ncbi:MAG: hypothetical protein RDU20_08595 [Desulfomonilaceae bacterium]|nr:hypothetical protein [Desulfomonilaceae bacterium]
MEMHMVNIPHWSSAAPRIRTVFFLAAMIPVAVIVFIVSLLLLVPAIPWIVSTIVYGEQAAARPKLPWYQKRSE